MRYSEGAVATTVPAHLASPAVIAMPKSRPATSSDADARTIHDAADALYRSATECCRQHDRLARLSEKPVAPDEESAVQQLVTLCDRALVEATAAYEGVAARARPPAAEQEWWHRANILWYGCREFARRSGELERGPRGSSSHSASNFGDLHIEYELAASSLLALRHSCEAYARVRPGAA